MKFLACESDSTVSDLCETEIEKDPGDDRIAEPKQPGILLLLTL